jgi:hypothetical protein
MLLLLLMMMMASARGVLQTAAGGGLQTARGAVLRRARLILSLFCVHPSHGGVSRRQVFANTKTGREPAGRRLQQTATTDCVSCDGRLAPPGDQPARDHFMKSASRVQI